MSIDKISGKSDNIEPEKKGEKKLRDDVGSKFKEVEKTGAVDPDNRRRRRENADSLSEISTPKKDYTQTPPIDSNDKRGPIQVPAGSKSYDSGPSKNIIPSSSSSDGPVHDEVTYGPNENTDKKEPTQTAAHKEKELKAKLKAEAPQLKAKPLSSPKAKGDGEKSDAPKKKEEKQEPPKPKVAQVPKEHPLPQPKGEKKETPQVKTPEPSIKKSEPPKKEEKTQLHEKKEKKDVKEKEAPLTQGDAIEVHGSAAQPTIIIGQPAPPPPPPSGAASSQLSHPEVARLFDQMVSHLTAIASKGVKEVTITLSSGIFRGSQIVIRETSTALRNYNVELRGLDPKAQKLFEENIGSLVQLFSNQKYPFTIHRLEARHLIERKERLDQEKEDEEPEK